MATRTPSLALSAASASGSACGKPASTASTSAGTPRPCADESANGDGNPSVENSASAAFSSRPSVLLTASSTGLPLRRRCIEDVAVRRQQAFARIDHEHDAIGLGHGELRLARGQCTDAFFIAGQSAGIDDHELAHAQSAHAILAVARQPGQVVHERVARAREHVEERGFADVGAADESNYRKHVREPLTNLLRSAACGLAVLGILIYFARKLRFQRSGSPPDSI